MTSAAQPGRSTAPPAPAPRIVARARPASEPGCAGCPQLGVFRALRRAGLDVQGGSGCAGDPGGPFQAANGRWAAVTGAGPLLADPERLFRDAVAAGARLLVVVDRAAEDRGGLADLLAGAGPPVATLDLRDVLSAEDAIRRAADAGGAAIVALSRCVRGTRDGPPLEVAASRCNRCGACLSLACAAISDPGGEAMRIDPAICTGCGLCARLCRGGAIGATPSP